MTKCRRTGCFVLFFSQDESKKKKILHIFFFTFFECFWYFFLVFSLHLQDEKNQIIVTNVWLNLVSSFIFKRGNTHKIIKKGERIFSQKQTNQILWTSTLSLLYLSRMDEEVILLVYRSVKFTKQLFSCIPTFFYL